MSHSCLIGPQGQRAHGPPRAGRLLASASEDALWLLLASTYGQRQDALRLASARRPPAGGPVRRERGKPSKLAGTQAPVRICRAGPRNRVPAGRVPAHLQAPGIGCLQVPTVTQAPRHPGTQAPRHPGAVLCARETEGRETGGLTLSPSHPGTQAPRHPGTRRKLCLRGDCRDRALQC